MKLAMVKSDYKCSGNNCDFFVTIFNEGDSLVDGYIRINAFKMVGRVKSSKEELVATKRVEFKINGNQEKVVKESIVASDEPSRLQISIGVIEGR